MDLEEARERILEISRRISALTEEEILRGPAEGVRGAFRELDRLAEEPVDPRVVVSLKEDPVLRGPLRAISRLRTLYGLRLEVETAEELLGASDPWDHLEGFPLYENYRLLAEAEGEAVDLRGDDFVVMLGAGPLPMSLVMHHRLFGTRGLGIERDHRWAALAKRVIERLGIGEKITMVRGDEGLLPALKGYRLLIVAALAEPKGRIFDLLSRCLPPQAFVSCRLYEQGLRAILYDTPPLALPAELCEVARIPPRPPVKNTVLIVRRAAGS